jgi:hypothetical protein
MSERNDGGYVKESIRLEDGRELIFYNFEENSSSDQPGNKNEESKE